MVYHDNERKQTAVLFMYTNYTFFLNQNIYMNKILAVIIIVSLSLPACQNAKVKQLEQDISNKETQIVQLTDQVDHLQGSNTSLLDRLSDMSVISQTESKSIQTSLENIGRQNAYIQNLTDKLEEKDSINFALVTNLKRSLIDIDDSDLEIEVRGSAVYVSISDKLLFSTGSTIVNKRSYDVLSKVASVINDHDQLNILVEGHTDNVPINNSKVNDNWDLSVLRATSIVRLLQEQYYVAPERLTAAGRSSYLPKGDNDNLTGRSENRRTEIIMTPKMDQFFKLLESPDLAG